MTTDTRPDPRRFRLTDPRDNSDVMGGSMPIGNPDKAITDLAVGESVLRVYALSGQKPTTYRLVRVEDAFGSCPECDGAMVDGACLEPCSERT